MTRIERLRRQKKAAEEGNEFVREARTALDQARLRAMRCKDRFAEGAIGAAQDALNSAGLVRWDR